MNASTEPAQDAAANDPVTEASLLATGRAVAPEICRGVVRLLIGHGLAPQTEVSLPNGRRADVMALSKDGQIWIVEIKSSVEDFRTDQKWPEYRDYCDALWFAVRVGFPVDILPEQCGLVLADRFGGEIIRQAPVQPLAAARRKAMTLRLARSASLKLAVQRDPGLSLTQTVLDG